MKRTSISIEDIAEYKNLWCAAYTAARGKRTRGDVRLFFRDVSKNINRLRNALIDGRLPCNRFKTFTIFDPKERNITAVCFEDRIIHHALMNRLGPVLDKALVPFTFACRTGKGPLKAVMHAQRCMRNYQWYVKIDINKYFESIDHSILLHLLDGKFKGEGLHLLLNRIIGGFSSAPGEGLPIGSLTSQHFANYYLDGLDRFVLETAPVCGYVRYMDDIIWWCGDKKTARSVLEKTRLYAAEQRRLSIKDTFQINRCARGLTFCGFRILPGAVRLSIRRKRRYARRRTFWEKAYGKGLISSRMLQNAYASVKGIVAHGDCTGWMRNQIRLHPSPDV